MPVKAYYLIFFEILTVLLIKLLDNVAVFPEGIVFIIMFTLELAELIPCIEDLICVTEKYMILVECKGLADDIEFIITVAYESFDCSVFFKVIIYCSASAVRTIVQLC